MQRRTRAPEAPRNSSRGKKEKENRRHARAATATDTGSRSSTISSTSESSWSSSTPIAFFMSSSGTSSERERVTGGGGGGGGGGGFLKVFSFKEIVQTTHRALCYFIFFPYSIFDSIYFTELDGKLLVPFEQVFKDAGKRLHVFAVDA